MGTSSYCSETQSLQTQPNSQSKCKYFTSGKPGIPNLGRILSELGNLDNMSTFYGTLESCTSEENT